MMSKKNSMFWRNYLFVTFSIMKWNVPANFARYFCGVSQSSILKILGKIFRWKKNKNKVRLLHQCRTLNVIMLTFWQNYSNKVGETAFCLSIGPFLGKKMIIFFSFFDSQCKFFGLLLTIFHRGCKKFIPRVQWNISMNCSLFQREVCFYRFWTLIGGFLQLSQRKIGSVVETTFYVS